MKIHLLLLLISNLISAQYLKITGKQLNESNISVKIKNISYIDTFKIILDEKKLEYTCDYDKKWSTPSNFARLAICFDYPRHYNYQSSIVPFNLTKNMYGNNQDLSIIEYIEQNTLSLKPQEEKEIIYNVSDFNNSLIFQKRKKFKLKLIVIYFGENVKEELSNAGINKHYFYKNVYSSSFEANLYFYKP